MFGKSCNLRILERGGEMMKPIPELPFDIEGTEEKIREYLKFIPRIAKFDAILQYYQEEITELKLRIKERDKIIKEKG